MSEQMTEQAKLVERHNLASRCVTAVEQAHTASASTKIKMIENILHSTWIRAEMADALARENSDHLAALATPAPKVDGVEAFVEHLRAFGYKQAIVTLDHFGGREIQYLTEPAFPTFDTKENSDVE